MSQFLIGAATWLALLISGGMLATEYTYDVMSNVDGHDVSDPFRCANSYKHENGLPVFLPKLPSRIIIECIYFHSF